MKRKYKRCLAPFEDYVGYKYELDSRMRVYLWNRATNERLLMTLARYRLSVKLGRVLDTDEEVDHRDENIANDDVSNLQVLSKADNIRKTHRALRGTLVSERAQRCTICRVKFTSYRRQKFCSRVCADLERSPPPNPGLSVKIVKQVQKLRASGMSSYAIAERTGLARNTIMKYW